MSEKPTDNLWRLAYRNPLGITFYMTHCGGMATLAELGVLYSSEDSAKQAIPSRAQEWGMVWEPEACSEAP